MKLSQSMENLERELICPLCKDYFTTPLLLPCQHNVCHKCAKEYVMGGCRPGIRSPGPLNGHIHGSHSLVNSPRGTPSSGTPRDSPVTSPRTISPAGSVTSLPGEPCPNPKSPPESPRPPRPTSTTPSEAAIAARKKKALRRRATLSGPPILPSKNELQRATTPRETKRGEYNWRKKCTLSPRCRNACIVQYWAIFMFQYCQLKINTSLF